MSYNPGSGSNSGSISTSSDVALSNLQNGQVLTWSSGTAKWKNGSSATGTIRLVESGGAYPTRPLVQYVEFVGPDDPGSAAQTGDTWIATAL